MEWPQKLIDEKAKGLTFEQNKSKAISWKNDLHTVDFSGIFGPHNTVFFQCGPSFDALLATASKLNQSYLMSF